MTRPRKTAVFGSVRLKSDQVMENKFAKTSTLFILPSSPPARVGVVLTALRLTLGVYFPFTAEL